MEIVGLITALRIEASCISSFRMPLNRMMRLCDTSVVWMSGMGDDAARMAATELLDRGVTALVSFGVAGALDPDLRPGDLIVPESIYTGEALKSDEEERLSYPVSADWRHRLLELLPPHLSVTGGSMVASPGVLTTAKAKLELGAATGACAVDMESFAIAEVAARAKVPFIAIRAITDPVEFSPPPVLLHAVQPEGSVKIMMLLMLLFQRRVSIDTLIRLGKEVRAARSTLAAVIRHAEKELGNMPHMVTIP